MKKTLVDAGPLIALFDRDDKHHSIILNFLRNYRGLLVTTWPVITEVLHMLDFNVGAQLDFLEWIQKGGLLIERISEEDLSRIIELTRKYRDISMDLADISLIIVSEKTGINEIVTIDSDFNVYRNVRNNYMRNTLL
jgi:predicted nucleic acid-binding protein